jgi:hypothetical protein
MAKYIVVLVRGIGGDDDAIEYALSMRASRLTAEHLAILQESRPRDRINMPGCDEHGHFAVFDRALAPDEQMEPGHLGLRWRYLYIGDDLTRFTRKRHCVTYVVEAHDDCAKVRAVNSAKVWERLLAPK